MPPLGFRIPKEELAPQLSSKILNPVSRSSMTSQQKNRDHAYPLGVTGFDVENPPVSIPRAATKLKLETEPADSEIRVQEQMMSILAFLKIVTAISAAYVSASTWFFFYDPDKGEICPYTVICATNAVELSLLTLSRLSAGALWTSITIAILTKCYATRAYLHNSWLGAVLDFEPTHDVHTYFGFLTLCAGLEHGVLHCIRFVYSHNAWLIYETDVGRSGMVVCLLLLPIVLPMKFEFFRTKMTFQTRKNMHMLFLAMLVALCFHSVTFRYVGSILIVWYLLDRLYFTTKQTFLIAHPVFEAVGRGTMVGLDLPAGYTFKAGSYIYVNAPTISRSEWHPFSIIQVPGSPPRAAFYAEAVGDWTQELFRLGLGQPRLPLWITAAQPSLMEKSIYYDNIVLVCTGAGITPAASIMERFAMRKNIHLMWMSRDSGMIALFEKQLRKVNSTVHLTGNQAPETKDALQRLLAPPIQEAVGFSSKRSVVRGRSLVHSLAAIQSAESDHSVSAIPPQLKSLHSKGTADEFFRLGNHNTFGFEHTINTETEDNPGVGVKRLDSLPEKWLTKDDPLQRSENRIDRSGRLRSTSRLSGFGSNIGVSPPSDPVTLNIGRPDIAKYLTETFADKTRGSGDASGETVASMFASNSAKIKGDPGRPKLNGREISSRLDTSQINSKDMLMKADAKVVEACRKNSTKPPSAAGSSASSGADMVPSNGLPWIVLYCGANPKVEKAIGTVCDDLKVTWQKEYFGAW